MGASAGGTPIEAWMSKDALKELPAILERGEKFRDVSYRESITRRDDSVSNPTAVRYAWADAPEGANLYIKEGLPASPFEAKK